MTGGDDGTMFHFQENSTHYGLFHVSWTTFDFNGNQLGTVSPQVISPCHRGMNVCMKDKQELLSKDFKTSLWSTGMTAVFFILFPP